MNFTLEEQKALNSLIRQERRWQSWRFVSLALGLGIALIGSWMESNLTESLIETTRGRSSTEPLTGVEVFSAIQYGSRLAIYHLFPIVGGAIIGLTITRWRGERVNRLIIALSQRALPEQGAARE